MVTINAPLHPETEHLFDDELIGRMKRGAYLVNTARGKICDRDAVARACESGQLAGYAGDVWFPQPAPQDHPWRTMPNHGMTPHTSGTSLSAQARYAAGVREILECWFDGRPIREEYLIVDAGQLRARARTPTAPATPPAAPTRPRASRAAETRSVSATELLNVSDYERAAEERLDPASFGYFAGGANDEWTLRENVAAFGRCVLRPRMLVDVSTRTTATTVLGTDVACPVLVAPVAFQGLAHPDAEKAMARGAAAAGTVMCLSTLSTASLEEVAEAAPEGARWFQLYWGPDRSLVQDLVERAGAAGYRAIVVTVDLPELGRRERDLRAGFEAPSPLSNSTDDSLTWRDLEWLRARTTLPILVKGILTAEDAALALEAGAEGIVVSNHGGRQLDGVAASLDALPEVVEAAGDRAEILLDGGIRRGTDVVKALALGARAVLVGRAALYGLVVDGADGVERVLGLVRDEVELALALCGCASPTDVTRAHVGPAVR